MKTARTFSGRLAALLLSLLLGVLRSAAEAANPGAFYVSPSGRDTWSGLQPEPTEDGFDGPFATVVRARDAMRTGGIKITYLRGGTYRLTSPVVLTSADNGIAFTAYPGERPVLSGGERVTGWVAEGNGVYAAETASAVGLDFVINGSRQRVAQSGRWDPAEPLTSGWLFATAGADPKRQLRVDLGDLAPADLEPGKLIQVMNKWRWQSDLREISAVDLETATITLKAPLHYAADDATTFRIFNNPAHVRHSGEFSWRAADRKLIVKVDDPTLLDRSEVPRLATFIELRAASEVTLNGLGFVNGSHDGAAIRAHYGSRHSIARNTFRNVGDAIWIEGTEDIAILDNDMRYLAGDGVEGLHANGAEVRGNAIMHIGVLHKMAAGIGFANASRTVVSGNAIGHSSRYGIQFTSWGESYPIVDNTIENNRIWHTNQETSDAGAITMWNARNGVTSALIRNNHIKDTGGLRTAPGGKWIRDDFDQWGTTGIYLDDLVSNVRVIGNVIEGAQLAAIYIHGGDNNQVENNIGVLARNGRPTAASFVHFAASKALGEKLPSGNSVARNVVYSPVPRAAYVSAHKGGCQQIGMNLVYNAGKGQLPGCPPMDEGTRAVDPLFIDATRPERGLRLDSPAWRLGDAWFNPAAVPSRIPTDRR